MEVQPVAGRVTAQTATPETKTILTVENLIVQYGAFKAVKGISFSVRGGEIFGLLGPNGAGKTSTLSAIEGLLSPAAGKIVIDGSDLEKEPLHARAAIGVQLQSTSFQPELTVEEILRLFSELYGVVLSSDQRKMLLREINLDDSANKKFGQLSGGQQQRFALAIATIHNPPLVLLDEPTTGLDPQSRRQLWERLEKMRDNSHSVLLTTHSMEEAEAVCDRIAIVDHGQIVAIDAPGAIIEKHRNDPEVIRASRRGKITLEDVFIGLTGTAIRS
jgi:ABC-2 type transport system ATP-binding protein